MAEIKTIGISMRVVSATGYDEPRDALAHDWYPFLDWVFNGQARWLLIPNIGAEAVEHFVSEQRVDGLILTGGNDIGDSPIRDETERALIHYALKRELPLIGICRGLQMLWHLHGGRLIEVDPAAHIATRHRLYPKAEFAPLLGNKQPFEVNSYHGQGLSVSGRPADWIVLATTDNGQIEASMHQQAPILGVMWHPERETPYAERDRRLMRNILLGEKL